MKKKKFNSTKNIKNTLSNLTLKINNKKNKKLNNQTKLSSQTTNSSTITPSKTKPKS